MEQLIMEQPQVFAFLVLGGTGALILLVFGLYAWREKRRGRNWHGTWLTTDVACKLISGYFPHTADEIKQMPKREVKRLVRTCEDYKNPWNGSIRFPTLVDGKAGQLRNPFLDRLDPEKKITPLNKIMNKQIMLSSVTMADDENGRKG